MGILLAHHLKKIDLGYFLQTYRGTTLNKIKKRIQKLGAA